MKNFNSAIAFSALFVFLILSIMVPISASAATPSLGAASEYAILSSTFTNTAVGTTVTGSIGFTTPPAVVPAGIHPNYGSGAPYPAAGIDQGNALSALASESCTFTFAPGAVDLSTDVTHGPIGVYAPGVYCSTGAMDVSGPLDLNGSGLFIFRPVGALNTTAGAVVTLTNSSSCDVFWTPSAATTLGANTTFAGTVIDDSGITIGANTNWVGRALAYGGTVTTDTDTISAPSCPLTVPVVSTSTTSSTVTSSPPFTTSLARRQANMAANNVVGQVLGASSTSTSATIPTAVSISTLSPTLAVTPLLPTTGRQGGEDGIYLASILTLLLLSIGLTLRSKFHFK